MLTETDLERIMTRVLEKQLAPIAESLELTGERLTALEHRIIRIELRLGRLVENVTRGLTDGIARVASLEARVAELERMLEQKQDT